MTALNLIGRVLVDSVTNKSGGALARGDVVIVDTSNDRAVTTTTTARSETSVGIVIEENGIANNATGRVQFGGYVGLVNVPASVTRGHYIETHTVVKQATGSSTRRSGSFGQFATGGTTPTAWLWGNSDQTPNAAALTRSTVGTTSAGASTATAKGVYIKKVTLATDGFMGSIHGFVKGNGSNSHAFGVGLLTDNAGTPLSLIASTANMIEATSATVSNSGMSTTFRDWSGAIGRWLTAGDYWIGIALHAAAASTSQLAYNAGTGTDRKITSVSPIFSDQSYNSYGSSDTNDYCIYADILR